MGEAVKARTLLLQIPHQAGSSGGPVVNDDGDPVGMLAVKEGAQQQLGYAVASSELQSFIDSARPMFSPKTAAEFHDRGKYMRAKAQHVAAVAALRKAIELSPKDVGINRDLISALAISGDSPEVRQRLDSMMPESVEAMAWTAQILLRTGRRQEAKALCEPILKKDRKNAIEYMVRGCFSSGKDALADLDEAIFLAPQLIDAYRLRAVVHDGLGDDDKALADWSRAIELDPYSPEAIRKRALLYLKRREPKRAVADYEKLIDLAPKDGESHRGLATAWLAQGDQAKAVPALVAALRWDPGLRKAVFTDIVNYGGEQTRRWPDDPGKKAEWLEQALKAIRGVLDADTSRRISDALAGRKEEWDAKVWGDELERMVRALVR